jgi:hypothetical protein
MASSLFNLLAFVRWKKNLTKTSVTISLTICEKTNGQQTCIEHLLYTWKRQKVKKNFC